MDSKLSLSFFLLLLLVATSSTVQAELQELTPILTYWRSVLPQTPIPATIEQLLHPAGNKKYAFGIERSPATFISYKNAATENQIQNDDPNAQLFFLKDGIFPGAKLALDLAGASSAPPFLSLKEASEAPFSSGELLEILRHFSIECGSSEEAAVRRALAECEEPPLDGESKRCVTSVESMVEFVEVELGSGDVRIMETAIAGGSIPAGTQEYVVGPAGARLVRTEAVVSCHSEPYPRALYYCHKTNHIEIYKVQLLRSHDGKPVDAIMSCHTNTSAWNPGYIGFMLLKVKPGTQPICHFMPHDNLIFALVSKKSTGLMSTN